MCNKSISFSIYTSWKTVGLKQKRLQKAAAAQKRQNAIDIENIEGLDLENIGYIDDNEDPISNSDTEEKIMKDRNFHLTFQIWSCEHGIEIKCFDA